MKKLLLSGFVAIITIVGAGAQKAGYDPVKAPFGHGQDSIRLSSEFKPNANISQS